MIHPTTRKMSALTVVVALAGSACGGSGSARADRKIGIDFPGTNSVFWDTYASYVIATLQNGNYNTLEPTHSYGDTGTLVANLDQMVQQGAKAVVIAPQDTGAIAPALDRLAAEHIPVVSVDTRPDKGQVYMVVRADNRAYGEKSCRFLGAKLAGKGTVVEFEGDLNSVNGRDRSEGFGECMKANYPGIKVLAEATDWNADVATAKLRDALGSGAVNGIYMQAGGVFLAPTIKLLQNTNRLLPPSDPKHIVIVSNDGFPAELSAVRTGQIDATVVQPANLYAKYALSYAQAAISGKTFAPGPTDHGSTIIQLPNGLEDELPAPLVTKADVDGFAPNEVPS